MTGMQTGRLEKKMAKILDQSGAIAIVLAITFPVLCGFVALAVDVGHMGVVKAQLQRTADAGAQSGAVGLAIPPAPNLLQGQTAAANIVNDINNKADNQQFNIAISDVLISTINPASVQVMLSRDVALYFAPVIGFTSPKTVSATAKAILPVASSIKTGTFAMAVIKSFVYNPGTTTINTGLNRKIEFGVNSRWFTLDGSPSASEIRINTQMNALQDIYMAPGDKAGLYDRSIIGQTIIMPVLNTETEKTWQPILGFAAFKVTDVSRSGKYYEGNFLAQYIDPNAIIGPVAGEYFGTFSFPKLVSP